jgi:hypothetical protein
VGFRVAVAGIADVGPDGDRAPAFGFDKLAGVRQSASRRTGQHQVGTGFRRIGTGRGEAGSGAVGCGQQADHQVPVMVVVFGL